MEKIERLLKWSQGKNDFPFGIELSPTLKCNLECKFCWREENDGINYDNELSFEKYKDIIKEAAELKVKEIRIIGGGEAFCRKDMVKIMELIKQENFYGYVCTNGTLFNESSVDELIRIGWDYIKISLHGPDADTHDFLTGVKGSFDNVIKNIKLFQKYKKDKPVLEFGIVLVNKNYNKIVEMIELANKLDVQSVFVEPITVYSDVGKQLKLNDEQRKEFVKIAKEAKQLADKYKIQTNLECFFDTNLIENTNKMEEIIKFDLQNPKNKNDFFSIPCYEPFYRIGIRTDGVVGPCGFFDTKSLANVKDKSLKEIWFGDYFQKRRKQMLEKKLSNYCAKCCTTLVANNQEIRGKLKRCIGN
ncbi:hypothetical protein CL621_01580 [archaeon]|nr:hypothetical protein [archaeon]